MKLLFITQKIDKNDDLLGFVHGWIREMAKRCDQLIVICLFCGQHELPQNVRVLSLGKEKGALKLAYIYNFFKYILTERYDKVFVHMNQEYILLGGFAWKFLGKKVYFWRNHPKGNLLTDIAVGFSSKVFCVSNRSYTAKFKKTVLMPAGIDAEVFRNLQKENETNSVLSFGRISPVKKIEVLLEALEILKKENTEINCSIVGSAPERDKKYRDSLVLRAKEAGLKINWQPGVPYPEAPQVFNRSNIFINLTPSGSFDKTTLEAMACERLCLVSNKAYSGKIKEELIFKENDAQDLAQRIKWAVGLPGQQRVEIGAQLRRFAKENHGLDILIDRIISQLQ